MFLQSVLRLLVAPLISILNYDIEWPLDNLNWAALPTIVEIGEIGGGREIDS